MSDWIGKAWPETLPGGSFIVGPLGPIRREDVTEIIDKFCSEVNRRAESNMLKTGKLEGSHYAAQQQILNELRATR